jgi:hypothetical protein
VEKGMSNSYPPFFYYASLGGFPEASAEIILVNYFFMSKYIIPLLIIFIACLALGFFAAGKIQPSPSSTPTINVPDQIFHQNLIIIQVDDLKTANPKLFSVWGIFIDIYQDNSLEMAYMPLYPIPESPALEEEIISSFTLNANRDVSPKFLQSLKNNYNYLWDNYIILDQRALRILSDWITGIPSDPSTILPLDASGKHVLINDQENLLRDICQSMQSEILGKKVPFNWKKIYPNNFQTNQVESILFQNWEKIISVKTISQCKSLQNN